MVLAGDYHQALDYLSTVPLFAYAYFILGGAESGQGALITRNPNGTDHIEILDTSGSRANGWYVLQTNYDWNKAPLYLDDRRTPGNRCMQTLTRQRVGHQGLYQVLSNQKNLNKATVYTAVMQVNTGVLQSFIQRCQDPGWLVCVIVI